MNPWIDPDPGPGSASASAIGGPERVPPQLDPTSDPTPQELFRSRIDRAVVLAQKTRVEWRQRWSKAVEFGGYANEPAQEAQQRLERANTIYHALRAVQKQYDVPMADQPYPGSQADVGMLLINESHRTAHKILDDVARLLSRGHVADDVFESYLAVRANYLTGTSINTETRAREATPMAYTPKRRTVTKQRHEFEVEQEFGAPINIRMIEDAIAVATAALKQEKGERAADYDDALFFEPRDESIVIYFETEVGA